MTKKVIIYLHADKSDMRAAFEALCKKHCVEPSEDVCRYASYGCCEVALDVEFDLTTGECRIVEILKG